MGQWSGDSGEGRGRNTSEIELRTHVRVGKKVSVGNFSDAFNNVERSRSLVGRRSLGAKVGNCRVVWFLRKSL